MRSQASIFFLLFFALVVHSQNKNIFDIARKGSLEEVEFCYRSNANSINEIDDKKSSPLILACYRANEAVALFLADKVQDLNYNSGMGTALMAAIMSANTKIIDKLISKKVDLNQSDTNGKTALIYATFFNKNEIVKSLIRAGADLKLKDKEGRSALDYANFNKNTELIILLDH